MSQLIAPFIDWQHWHCFRCNRPFDNSVPQCTKCGAEPPAVSERVPVHFAFEDVGGPLIAANGMQYRLACKPTEEMDPRPWYGQHSGEPRAVTCLRCKDTKFFQDFVKTGRVLNSASKENSPVGIPGIVSLPL